MNIQIYLFFNGKCDEAVAYYKEVLGAELEMLMRFNESPEPHPPGMIAPEHESKVMHCSFKIGDTIVMASDGMCSGAAHFDGFSLSLNVANPAEADRLFEALAADGEVAMPIAKTFWSPRFGMVKDKFGVHWMVSAVAEA